jgi:hypothetical protein
MGPHEILLVSVMVAAFFLGRRHLDAISEAIENFRDNFRGGPPTPMHPSPVNDGALLRRRARKSEN